MSDGRVSLITSSSGNTKTSMSSTGCVTLNTWHHIAIVKEGSGARIYCDGEDSTVPKYELRKYT